MAYKVNPDRSIPWNNLPELPIDPRLYQSVVIYEPLGNAKGALGRLQGRSNVIPNQGLQINSINLHAAKASSAIENIFTTNDELYKAYSHDQAHQVSGPAKEILNYREALWEGFHHLQGGQQLLRSTLKKEVRAQTQAGLIIHLPEDRVLWKPKCITCSIF